MTFTPLARPRPLRPMWPSGRKMASGRDKSPGQRATAPADPERRDEDRMVVWRLSFVFPASGQSQAEIPLVAAVQVTPATSPCRAQFSFLRALLLNSLGVMPKAAANCMLK